MGYIEIRATVKNGGSAAQFSPIRSNLEYQGITIFANFANLGRKKLAFFVKANDMKIFGEHIIKIIISITG
jgi:hypothetical protein